MGRFSYIQFDLQALSDQKVLKELFELVEGTIVDRFLDGRSRSLALTKLEEAYMWTGKAIRDAQFERNKLKA